MLEGDLYAAIPQLLPTELIDLLVSCEGLRIERIISRGHTSPPDFWYDQDEHEFVLLVNGEARLEVAGQPQHTLKPGMWLNLPAHTKHRVAYTAPDMDTVWLAVFYSGAEASSPAPTP